MVIGIHIFFCKLAAELRPLIDVDWDFMCILAITYEMKVLRLDFSQFL